MAKKRASMREGPLADLFRATDGEEEVVEGEATEERADSGREIESGSSEPAAEVKPEPAAEPEEKESLIPEEGPFGSVPPARASREEELDEEPDVSVYRSESRRDTLSYGEDTAPAAPAFGREEPKASSVTVSTGTTSGALDLRNPVIRVLGVGGAGVNAVNRMVESGISGVEFIAINTDLQSLQQSTADLTVHIGNNVTRGLGSGSDPALGYQAAFEEQDRIKRLLKGSDLVFVAAGAGGGTGTGAAPVIARLSRDVGALTVGIVTRPFKFEGTRRAKQADEGIEALSEEVDTLIVVPNEKLLNVLARNTAMTEAFRVADDVLRQGVQGISDLVTLPTLINLDFADVRTTMRDAGPALLGIGMGDGDKRAEQAAQQAIASPLLETSMDGARSILLSITGGRDLSLIEVSEAANVVQEAAHPDANIIFGANVDEELDEQIWVTVIATRFDGRGRRRDGGVSSETSERRSVRPSARRSQDTRPGSGVPGYERRPRELGVDVPEFLSD